MNGQAATLARVTGIAAALIIAAILGILVGTALDAMVERVTIPLSNAGAMVPENPGGTSVQREATPQSNLGGLVPENPGGTIVTEGWDIDPSRSGQRKAPDSAPDSADPYRDHIEGPM